MNTCSKRVILHSGVDLNVGISAALAFDKDYVLTGKGSTGIYHLRTYTGTVQVMDPVNPTTEDVQVDVHQSETSIIVRPSTPVPESEAKPDLASMMPEQMFPDPKDAHKP